MPALQSWPTLQARFATSQTIQRRLQAGQQIAATRRAQTARAAATTILYLLRVGEEEIIVNSKTAIFFKKAIFSTEHTGVCTPALCPALGYARGLVGGAAW